MRKFIIFGIAITGLFISGSSRAQQYDSHDRAGLFVSVGMNNINGTLESKTNIMRSLKGNASIMPVLGGFYELAIDKNMSMIFSGGIGYNTFNYSFTGEYNTLKEVKQDDVVVGFHPDGPGATIKRSLGTWMLMPQFELNLTSNAIRQTTFIDFRAGLGAAIYLNSTDINTGDAFGVSNGTASTLYYYLEDINIGGGNNWGSTFGSLYLGMRWRNTTSEFLNRSTLGVQMFLPFNSPRSGGVNINYQNTYWTQEFQNESLRFKLNTISLKYSYSFSRLYN